MYKASSATALLRIGHWSVMLEVSPDAILPRFQRRLHVYRASALPASKLSPCLQVGTTASPQAARMLVGRSIVPDSSEARRTSREAPSDVLTCSSVGWVEAVDGASTSGLGSDFEPPEEFLAL